MIKDQRTHTALPAADLTRARRFYEEKLGLEPARERPEGVTYEWSDGSAVFLFPSPISGRGGHTQLGIEVPDVEAAVAELKGRGVAFEDYEAPETVGGIATEPGGTRAAWFKDSEDNLLVLVQFS